MGTRRHSESDRRSWPRYPFEAALEYRLIRGRKVSTGRGKTVNVSSRGVLFQSDKPLAAGAQIELAIAWPALLNDAAGLTLHVTGRTVRSQENCAAVRILRYEFRTRAAVGPVAVPPRTRIIIKSLPKLWRVN